MRVRILAMIFVITSGCSAPCKTWDVTVNADGTFSYAGGPPDIKIRSCDAIRWSLLGHNDSVVRVEGITATSVPEEVCFSAAANTSSYVYPHASAVTPAASLADPAHDRDFTGPVRRGLSGIWVLGPEGDKTSYLELPSEEAKAVYCGLHTCPPDPDWNTLHCEDLTHKVVTAGRTYQYVYQRDEPNDSKSYGRTNPMTFTGGDGITHQLCQATTQICDPECVDSNFAAWDTATIPPGTHLNGPLLSTYENPDVTGVVLRFNWRNLEYDDPSNPGSIELNWKQLDHELEQAIAYGKYVTLDVRAGQFGTPDWIFTDYLDHASPYHAPWCAATGCTFTNAPSDAAKVKAIEFTDHYDEDPPGTGCGEFMRIGAPGDPAYVALYTDFIRQLASHLASDERWFQTVAHVKVSGANLRTSEAELPHHCDDQYIATPDHRKDPKDPDLRGSDRVLDVFKTEVTDGNGGTHRLTKECVCNPMIWWNHGYTPQQLFDYYAAVENQIQVSFFGRKSLGYQLLQDGFPRADSSPGGSFLGDHMYSEELVANAGVLVNASTEICPVPPEMAGVLTEDLAAGTAKYCSIDSRTDAAHVWLAIAPLLPLLAGTNLAAYTSRGPRYPGSFEQTKTVIEEARLGRFVNPTLPAPAFPNPEGKLFVPQHSGLQPLPQERVHLGYEDTTTCHGVAGTCPCDQQLARSAAPAGHDMGFFIAAYPIASGTTLAGDVAGCPNVWATDPGVQQYSAGIPTQLTGFQTTNAVRNRDELESTLFNLTYNTNAVFLEAYEDVIWSASIQKGTGPCALPLSTRVAGTACEYSGAAGPVLDLCYSKNLSQWSNELHYRRAQAAAAADTTVYPALAAPFPSDYTYQFFNTSGAREVLYYINPAHCNPALVDLTGTATANAIGRIVVEP